MLTSNDVREVKFVKSMSGYKQEDVDNFLDRVEEDFRNYEEFVKTAQEKIEQLTNELEASKNAQDSIQNIIVSAHQLADKIVTEANQKAEEIVNEAAKNAEEITTQAKQMMNEFDEKFSQTKAEAQASIEKEMAEATAKKQAMEEAATEAVKAQQATFDRLKIEVAQFKAEITKAYEAQMALIAKLPEDITMDAQRAADAVSIKIGEQTVATPEPIVEKTETQDVFAQPDFKPKTIMDIIAKEEAEAEKQMEAEEKAEAETVPQEIPVDKNQGFKVDVSAIEQTESNDIFSNTQADEEEDDFGFSSSFFKRNKG